MDTATIAAALIPVYLDRGKANIYAVDMAYQTAKLMKLRDQYENEQAIGSGKITVNFSWHEFGVEPAARVVDTLQFREYASIVQAAEYLQQIRDKCGVALEIHESRPGNDVRVVFGGPEEIANTATPHYYIKRYAADWVLTFQFCHTLPARYTRVGFSQEQD